MEKKLTQKAEDEKCPHKQKGFCLDCISIKYGEHVSKFVEKGKLISVMRWATHADNTSIQSIMKGVSIVK